MARSRHTPPRAFGDPATVGRVGSALLLANIRYWTSLAPIVRGELRRWEQRARAIEDPELRALALDKLDGEGFHAQAAAMLATNAPRACRRDVVRAIVALELLFDYLDGLTERPSGDPLRDGELLFQVYVDAVSPAPPIDVDGESSADGGYLQELSDAVRDSLSRLPAARSVAEVAHASAVRSSRAQTRMHAAYKLGPGQVEEWARGEVDGTDLDWRELLAGAASSVLAVHALIAAAADPCTTREDAVRIERSYLSTCVVLTLLDGLVDHHQDAGSSEPQDLGYLDFFADGDELSQTLTTTTRSAAVQALALHHGPHHAAMLVGVVAYYTSHPGADSELARPIAKRLRRELTPLIFPTLALMRAWRLAKRARNRRSRSFEGLASSTGAIPQTRRIQ
jgi:tetraprenyl-beta-curcumene synthase